MFLSQYPFSPFTFHLSPFRSLTTLIPVYDETVLYPMKYLVTPTTGPNEDIPPKVSDTIMTSNTTSTSTSTSTSSTGQQLDSAFSSLKDLLKLRQDGILPLEFLVSKYPREWNNLTERIGYSSTLATVPPYDVKKSQNVDLSKSTGRDQAALQLTCPADLTPLSWDFFIWFVENGQKGYIVRIIVFFTVFFYCFVLFFLLFCIVFYCFFTVLFFSLYSFASFHIFTSSRLHSLFCFL